MEQARVRVRSERARVRVRSERPYGQLRNGGRVITNPSYQWDESIVRSRNHIANHLRPQKIGRDEVLKFWFLLEGDMKEAIENGNLSLIAIAQKRIEYLMEVIDQKILEECVRGEEDSLCSVTSFLRNKGWWEKARKLEVSHYKERIVEGDRALRRFVQAHAHLVDKQVMRQLQAGDKESLDSALRQIHLNSIEQGLLQEKSKIGQNLQEKQDGLRAKGQSSMGAPSYKKALVEGEHRKSYGAPPFRKSSQLDSSDTVFFTGFPDSALTRDLWAFFKKGGLRFKDLILPRKRDKWRRRFGFIRTTDISEASKFISYFNGKTCLGGRLKLEFAKSKLKPPSFSATMDTQESGFVASVGKDLGTVKSPPKEIHQTPHATQEIKLDIDEDLVLEMDSWLTLITAIPLAVEEVEMILCGFGFGEASVKGVRSDLFIAQFPSADWVKGLDLDFMEIGFKEIRAVKLEDLIPSRKAWIECRGLPLVGRTTENLRNLASKFGRIVKIDSGGWEEGILANPKFQVETEDQGLINVEMAVRLENSSWNLHFIEFMGQLDGECLCPLNTDLEGSSPAIERTLPSHQNVGSTPIHSSRAATSHLALDDRSALPNKSGTESRQVEDAVSLGSPSVVNESVLGNTGTLVSPKENPVTPFVAETSPTGDGRDGKADEVQNFHVACWKSRKMDQGSPESEDKQSPKISNLSSTVEDNSVAQDAVSNSIMNALLKMKIKPKRGRPRSCKKERQNKYLKIPKRRRSLKGPGLPKICVGKGADERDEAQAILETGVLMGLIPVNGMDDSLALIRDELLD